MKLEILQKQLQLENPQEEENREIEAKVEEVFESVIHLHEEPDICTIPIGTKKDAKKEATTEVVDGKLPLATPAPKPCNLAETKQCTKNDNATQKLSNSEEYKITKPPPAAAPKECTRNDTVIRRHSTAGECKITKDLKESALPLAKEGIALLNGPPMMVEQMKSDEIPHKPKLDEIFPNLVEGSKMDIFSESACSCLPTEKMVVKEERVKSASPIPAKKAKMEISEHTCNDLPILKAESVITPMAGPEKTSVPDQPPQSTSAKELGDKHPPPNRPIAHVTETKHAKTENKANIAPRPVSVKREEKEKPIGEDPTAAKPNLSSCSRTKEDGSFQERKLSKQRPTSVNKSPAVVRHKEPPKESMMAGGECFASVGGIEPEVASNVAAATPRRTSNVTQQSASRETTISRTGISKELNKLRNNKNWKRKHLVIAGGIGIAMVCCYAYYKTKT